MASWCNGISQYHEEIHFEKYVSVESFATLRDKIWRRPRGKKLRNKVISNESVGSQSRYVLNLMAESFTARGGNLSMMVVYRDPHWPSILSRKISETTRLTNENPFMPTTRGTFCFLRTGEIWEVIAIGSNYFIDSAGTILSTLHQPTFLPIPRTTFFRSSSRRLLDFRPRRTFFSPIHGPRFPELCLWLVFFSIWRLLCSWATRTPWRKPCNCGG